MSSAGPQLHRMVAEHLTESGVILLDAAGRVMDWNPGAERVFGWTAAEIVGATLERLFLPDDIPHAELHDDLTQAEAIGRAPFRRWMQHKDGRRVWVEGVTLALRDARHALAGYGCVFRDKTQRQRAEDSLRASERHLRTVLDCTPDCIKLLARDATLLDMNPAGLEVIGAAALEFVRGHCVFDLVAPEDRAAYREMHAAVIEGEDRRLEFDIIGLNGRRRRVATHAVPLPGADGRFLHLGVTRDVTEQRRLEEQVRQSQKMDAIGQLAGGVAHDFNNILAVIIGYGDLALTKLPHDHAARDAVAEIVRAGERAVRLTRQLLAFSRRQAVAPRPLDLNAVVADMESLLRRLLGEGIALSVRLDPDAGRIRGDASQIEQVILNLAVNARDAMPRGGRIDIATRRVVLDGEFARTHPTIAPGEYVRLAVSDTGTGLSDEAKARLFEPFFTTKAPGQGTGLGLATVYGIATQCGGIVEADSERDVGTTFTVYLPRIEAAAAPEASPLPSVRVPIPGCETVLVVEDDPSVRSLTRHVLKSGGYVVLESEDGLEALRVAEAHAGPIQLLLTDVMLPGIDGRELAQRLCAARSEMRVMFTSGYTEDAAARPDIRGEAAHFLEKPFLPAALLQRVRDLLDTSATAAPLYS